MDTIRQIFSSGSFMPHGHCYLWDPGLLWLHIASDALITLSYFSIPFTLVYFIRKRKDLPFNWMFVCFAIFIVACGTTHLMEIWVIWHPTYWLSGSIKVITALASLPTAILLVKLVPKALAIPGRGTLARINEKLETEIAERKRFEVSLRKADRLKSEFLANMSHELRTPLNGIIGFSEFLVDGKPGGLNPKQAEYITDILNNGRHLLQLINDVLDLSKVEAGKMELNPAPFAVEKAISEACAVVKAMAQKKRIQIQATVAAELGTVTLDEGKFKQVLYNLLSNAVKFTNEGGRVEIAARRDGDRFQVQVRDTGIGIRREDFERLFLEFSQLDSGAGRRFEGTGLGLALTKKIVEILGGEISVASEEGKGSTFTVAMPMALAEAKK
jgi:signal transduction histidine kinase